MQFEKKTHKKTEALLIYVAHLVFQLRSGFILGNILKENKLIWGRMDGQESHTYTKASTLHQYS